MSTIVIERNRPQSNEGPVFTGPGRWAAASLFVIGAGLQVAEFLLEQAPADNAERVASWVQDPGRIAASQSVGLLAVPFLLGGFAVLVTICRRHSKTLATIAGALLTLAMAGLAGVHGVESAAFKLAMSGESASAVTVLGGEQAVTPLVVMMVIFLGGAALGSLALAAAVWLSPLLPRLAAIGIVAFAVLDFAVSTPVISHIVAFVTSLLVGWAIVAGYSRAPRNAG